MITLLAFFMMKAASSALPCFTGRVSLPAATAAPSPVPKPPRITEMKLRFMPLHMMYERIAPEEPTSAPVMISATFSSVKPSAAAAQPEYELSIETTTGMSAPPMGMINNTPISSESPASAQKCHATVPVRLDHQDDEQRRWPARWLC